MKVCFIGLGSIASRHIKNLREIVKGQLEIDVLRSSNNKEIAEELRSYIHQIYYSYLELPTDYDVIFITNPTRLHYETLLQIKNSARHFFIEKPVFETGEEDLKALDFKEGTICYVACPLRYTNVIQYLKENIDFKKVYSVRCISSSYLPQWRPGIDYRQTYSARKELGGGVSIDLIHEWDYICYLLGIPEKVKSFIYKKSNLEIDSDDIAIYIAEYSDKLVELHLDYFGRVACRKIEIFSEEDTIEADLIEQKILFKKQGVTIDLNEDRDSYQKKELVHFLDIVEGNRMNNNGIEEACQVLRITRGGK